MCCSSLYVHYQLLFCPHHYPHDHTLTTPFNLPHNGKRVSTLIRVTGADGYNSVLTAKQVASLLTIDVWSIGLVTDHINDIMGFINT